MLFDPPVRKLPAPPQNQYIQEFEHDPRAAGLAEKYRRFLEEVDVLLSTVEREAFFALTQDYERDAFIREFWLSRDPYPDTARNELKVRYDERVEEVRREFRSFADVRSRAMLYLGVPAARFQLTCSSTVATEVWFYTDLGRFPEGAPVIFYRKWNLGPWRLYEGVGGLAEFQRPDSLATGTSQQCYYEKLTLALGLIGQLGMNYLSLLSEVEHPPEPKSVEWVTTFTSYSTMPPARAERFEAELVLRFPGWYGRRTVVEGIVEVPIEAAQPSPLAGADVYNFVLNGEVLRGDELFERFRYRFDVPLEAVREGKIQLVFQRYLRPGEGYRLAVRIEDVSSGHFARVEQPLSVPEAATAMPDTRPLDPETARLLAEAEKAIAKGEAAIQLVRPMGDLAAGLVRFDTLLTGGERVRKVVFSLDGEAILTKAAPPYSVELDLGAMPRVRVLRATALDEGGDEVASDELLLNTGGQRFAVRLTDPARGKVYHRSVRARAQVEVPEGEQLERLELWVNEERRATLYEPPWVQPLLLPAASTATYVRAVAVLADGATAEDLVWVNAPAGESEVVNVDFVELYTGVFDRDRRPVLGLERSAFRVREDGVEQQLARFETVQDAPLAAAILLDVSASMEGRLVAAKAAALGFFQAAATERDRFALLTFNDRPYLAAKFTRDLQSLARGLSGLKAERGTALYDSLIFSLFSFNGMAGQRALILLSDGEDESSRYTYEQALEYARRSGVTLYVIALNLEASEATRKLRRLADETGGRLLDVPSTEELPAAYDTILRDLRSRYLLAYQSANTGRDERFRTVEVELARRGLEAHTIRGYYP